MADIMIMTTLTHALQQLYSQDTQACHLAFISLSTQCTKVQLLWTQWWGTAPRL